MKQWPPIDPGEVEILTFNFAPDLNPNETLLSPSMAITQIAGAVADTAISSILVGSPTISGATVQQTVTNIIANNCYGITAWCTTSQGRKIPVGGAITGCLAYLQ